MSNANEYRADFDCADPETGLPVRYAFTVRTTPPTEVHPADFTMRVHQLARKAATLEQLADKFRTQWPGKHSLACSRYGVKVTAKRDGTGL